MLTCPHCTKAISAADVQQQRCPHCGGRVLSGEKTLDADAGAQTLDIAPATPITVVNTGDQTIDLPSTSAAAAGSGSRSDRHIQPTVELSGGASDVDSRLHVAWGTVAEGSPPRVTMRGAETVAGGSTFDEKRTLVVRERALLARSSNQAAIADYDLLEKLGEGGMGVVYSARQASIDREVAVKMLRADMVQNETLRRKFLSEAAVTGELDHPNIVPIYDLGQNAEGSLFYSMKKVLGTPWSDVIQERSLLDNLSILMKVADAVAFAHARGVIHRDLKPENVMLGEFGEVLVLDWGLAVATEGHRPTPNVTTAFNIGGTPAYMAPELAVGPVERIGRHSDTYLLGAILYEIVTGRPPHTGKNARTCLTAAARNEILPTEKRGELIDIARKAMATEPADRYPSVRAFQDAIRQYQAHTESIALGERAEQQLQTAGNTGEYRDFARALFAFEEACALWSGNEAARAGVSQAKQHYAAQALARHDFDLGLSLLDPADLAHRPLHGQLTQAKQERDARQRRLKRLWQVVVGLAALVFLATTVGMVLVTLLKLEADRQAAIAKKNATEADRQAEIARTNETKALAQEQIALTNETKARTAEAEAKTQEQLARTAEAEAQRRRKQAEHEAYGALIAMAAAKIDENAFDQARQALGACQPDLRGWEWRRLMYVVNQGRGQQVPLPARADCLAMSDDGKWLATGSRDGVVRVWNAATREVASQHEVGGAENYVTAVAFAPGDDQWLAIGANKAEGALRLWNRQTGEVRPLAGEGGHKAAVVQVQFSRDGSKLLTASHDHTARLWDRATGRPLVTYAGHSWFVWSAAFSPDESQVATASEDGTVRLWDAATGKEWARPDGQRVPFTGHRGPVYAVAFQPAPANAQDPAKAAPNLASAGYDKRVLLWKPADLVAFDYKRLLADDEVPQTPFAELRGHAAAVRTLSFTRDGRRLLSASSDHTLRIWYAQEEDLGYAIIRRGTLEKELRGHDGPVQAALFSPADPDVVASTGYDGRLRLWSAAAYHEERVIPGLALRGHVDAVMAARFSTSGQSIVTASRDRTAKKWRVADGREELTFREGHAYLTSKAIFFPDGQRLLTAAVDGTVRIWGLAAGSELRKIEGTGYRAAVALSSDGRWILTGSDQVLPVSTQGAAPRQHALLWDAETGQVLHTLAGHKVPINAVAFSADRKWAFTGDDNGVGNLWEPATGRHVARLDFHLGAITAAVFSADGKRLFTASADKTVCSWDLSRPPAASPDRQRLLKHPQTVGTLALAPGGRALLTGCEDGRLRLWDLDSAQQVWIADAARARDNAGSDNAESGNVNSVTISADGAWAATVDSVHNVVRLFAMDFAKGTGREILAPVAGEALPDNIARPFLLLRDHDALGWSATFSPDSRSLVTVGGDEARQWDLQSVEVASFGPHRPVTFADFSPDQSRVVTASWDHSARLWDAQSGQPVATLDAHSAGDLGGHTATVNCAVFAPGGGQVLTASEDGTVRLWDVQSRHVLRVFRGHQAGVTRAIFSQSGRQFVSASRDGTACLWSLDNDAQPLRLQGHAAAVLDVCFSADEQFVVTGSADNTARIWDAATGRELLKLEGHSGAVAAVAIATDSRGKLRVLTGSGDQTAKLWEVNDLQSGTATQPPTSRELLTLKGHTRAVTAVSFSPDASAALTAARDGVAILWPTADDAGNR
jgi:WD40 repeat protein